MDKDVKKTSQNAMIYFAANLITKFAAFFLIPVYTIFFSPANYGILNMIQIIVSFIFIFYTLGLKGALQRFFFDYKDNNSSQRKLVGNILTFNIIIGLTLSVILSIFGRKLSDYIFDDIAFFPFVLIGIWTAFLKIFHQLKLTILQIKQKAFFYTLLDSGFILSSIILTIIFVVILKLGLLGKVYLDISLTAIFAGISLFSLRKDVILNFDFKRIKEPLKFSLPLVPHMLSGFLLAAIDRVFLEQLKGLNQVGLYSLAFNIAFLMYVLIDAVRLAYTPYFNKKALAEGDKAKPEFAKLTTYGFAIYTFIGIVMILFSKELITLIASREYYVSYQILPIIVMTNIFNGLYFFFVRPLLFLKKSTGFVSIATISTTLLNVVLNYFLIISYGIKGAAWATFISIIVKVILVLIFSQKKYPLPYEFKRLVILSLIIALSIAFFYFTECLQISDIKIIFVKILFLSSLAGGIILLKFFKADEISQAKQLIRKIQKKQFKK